MSNDGSLNIITKVSGQAELNALFDKFEKGTISINEMSKAIKLNNEVYKNAPDVHNAFGAAVARNSVILKDAKDKAIDPLTSANGRMMKSYFQTGEELRRFYREQRVGDRTMREMTQAAGGLGQMMGGDGLGKVVGTLTSGFQQGEFSVNAMGIAAQSAGGKMAILGRGLMAMSVPLAILAGIWFLISKRTEDSKKQTEEYNKKLRENLDMQIKLGIVKPEVGIKEDEKKLKKLQDEYAKLNTKPKQPQDYIEPSSIIETRKLFSSYAKGETFQTQEQVDKLNEILALQIKIKEQKDAIVKTDTKTESIQESILELAKEMQKEEADGFNKGFAYLKLKQDAEPEEIGNYIKKLQLLKESTKDETLQLEIQKEINKKLSDETKAVKELAKEKKKADDDAYKASKAGRWNKLKTDMKEWLDDTNVQIDAVSGAIGGLASGWTQAISGLISGTQNIGQAFTAMKDAVVQALTEIIAKMMAMYILQQLLGLFTGGASSVASESIPVGGGATTSTALIGDSGGWLNEPVSGIGMKTGTPYKLAWNGVPEHVTTIKQLNQMSQSSRGGNGNAAMAKAFQSLADKITPASASEVHYAMIKQSKIRSGRIM
jgi:murein DD-endopeptidase MepM/ murein hydrolase activator NlpD